MPKIKNAYFFGNNYKVAQAVNRRITLKHIYCEKRSYNRDIFNFAGLYNIGFSSIVNKDQLIAALPKNTKEALGISFGFGIIFRKLHIARFQHGIWNIHTGELPQNRGRHPITWDFLDGKSRFCVCIHQVNEDIDRGYLLTKGYVKRDLNDTQVDIEKKIDALLEDHLLEKAIRNYALGKKKKIGKGTYKKSLKGAFDDIRPEEHSNCFLFNLFKAQAKYGGVTVKGKRYTECTFYNEPFPDMYKNYKIFRTKDGKIGLR